MWPLPSAARPHSHLQHTAVRVNFTKELKEDFDGVIPHSVGPTAVHCTVSNGPTCVNEVGVHVQPGWADAPWAAVWVGQAQVS